MILMAAQEIFDEARAYLEGVKLSDGSPHPVDVEKAISLLNELLNHNVGHSVLLHVLGSAYLAKGHFGLAIQLLSQVTVREPKMGDAWNNLGLAFRGVNDWQRAADCCDKAAKLLGQSLIWSNAAGCYLNRGLPHRVLERTQKALEINPDDIKAQWHKALALLELGRYEGDAWDLHEVRLIGGANENIANRNYHGAETTPWWDGKAAHVGEKNRGGWRPLRVAIHGEQGMGDEIMFASCLPDAIATGAEIIFEPSPRVAGLMKRAFPDIKVHGTDAIDGKAWIDDWGHPDAKCALGSLPKFYRRSRSAFPSTPYLKSDPEKKAYWDTELKKKGDGFRVGLAWQGGVPQTRVETRSFHPRLFAPFFDLDVQFVSLQYDPTARQNVGEVLEQYGVEIVHFPKAVEARDPDTGGPSDLEELAAIIDCLDLVITVPQTAYHIAGGLGKPTWVLTPSEPDWRLRVEGDDDPWYGSVRLFRQEPGTREWEPVIAQVREALGKFVTPRMEAAE